MLYSPHDHGCLRRLRFLRGRVSERSDQRGWAHLPIDPLRCTECVGAKDEPQCQLECPAECIELNPDWSETREQLQTKYTRLHS